MAKTPDSAPLADEVGQTGPTRRQFLQRSAVAALTVAFGGSLLACGKSAEEMMPAFEKLVGKALPESGEIVLDLLEQEPFEIGGRFYMNVTTDKGFRCVTAGGYELKTLTGEKVIKVNRIDASREVNLAGETYSMVLLETGEVVYVKPKFVEILKAKTGETFRYFDPTKTKIIGDHMSYYAETSKGVKVWYQLFNKEVRPY